MFTNPLRPGRVRQTCVEHVFNRRIAARQCIADNDEIRCRLQMRGGVTGFERDPERGKLIAHRRVNVRVTALDAVSHFTRKCGDATHEGSADTEDVEGLGFELGHGLRVVG